MALPLLQGGAPPEPRRRGPAGLIGEWAGRVPLALLGGDSWLSNRKRNRRSVVWPTLQGARPAACSVSRRPARRCRVGPARSPLPPPARSARQVAPRRAVSGVFLVPRFRVPPAPARLMPTAGKLFRTTLRRGQCGRGENGNRLADPARRRRLRARRARPRATGGSARGVS